jgi:hypothetical protein
MVGMWAGLRMCLGLGRQDYLGLVVEKLLNALFLMGLITIIIILAIVIVFVMVTCRVSIVLQFLNFFALEFLNPL